MVRHTCCAHRVHGNALGCWRHPAKQAVDLQSTIAAAQGIVRLWLICDRVTFPLVRHERGQVAGVELKERASRAAARNRQGMRGCSFCGGGDSWCAGSGEAAVAEFAARRMDKAWMQILATRGGGRRNALMELPLLNKTCKDLQD
eukprot:scaffold239978_cov17-Tisochrysis_lutea.AAC.1